MKDESVFYKQKKLKEGAYDYHQVPFCLNNRPIIIFTNLQHYEIE